MHLFNGYVKPIKTLAVSHDSALLFSAGKGHVQVWQWDVPARQTTGKLTGAPAAVETLAVSPDGKTLLANTGHYSITAWPLAGGEPLHFERGHTHGGASTSFDVTGRLVVTPWQRWHARAAGVAFWDVGTGQLVRSVPLNAQWVRLVACCPGATLLAWADEKAVHLMDYETNESRFVLHHPAEADALAFRPDGEVLAVNAGRAVVVWDVRTGKQIRTLAGQTGATAVVLAYSRDGKYLASAGATGVLTLFDARTHEVAGQRHLEIGKISALTWRHDSAGMFVGGERPIVECDVAEVLGRNELSVKRGEPLSLAGHTMKVAELSYSPDAKTLASWGGEGIVRLWDMSNGAGQAKERRRFSLSHYYPGGPISWSPDGGQLVLGRDLRDARTGKLIRLLPESLFHAAFTPSGRLILVTFQGNHHSRALELQLTEGDAIVGRAEHRRDGYGCAPRTYAFGEGDRRVYALFEANVVSLWTPAEGTVTALVRQSNAKIGAMTVSDDERLLATAGHNTAYVWNLSHKMLRPPTLELKHPMLCTGIAFGPAGRLLTSCYDGLVRVWDLSGGTVMHAFDLGMGRVYGLAVSPDHMTFAAGVHKKNRIVLMDVPD